MSQASDRRIEGVASLALDRDNLAGRPSSIIGRTVALTVAFGQLVRRSEAPP